MGIHDGWAFQTEGGEQRTMTSFGSMFYGLLTRVQNENLGIIPNEMNIEEDFGLARSLRQGATTRATEAGVSEADIDWVNRWNIGDKDVVKGPMRVEYAERRQLMGPFIRFSQAL